MILRWIDGSKNAAFYIEDFYKTLTGCKINNWIEKFPINLCQKGFG
ncbi:hypothetical protein [Lactobacillus acetotolerans]|nr:hypothetical protein [Lactobacillus acetotolerans]QJD72750.1 hypothetical protein HG715_01760 [Lactobacillus acetotolerans]